MVSTAQLTCTVYVCIFQDQLRIDATLQHSTLEATCAAAVNNAGTNRAKPTVDYTQEDFDAVIGLNLQAMFRLCQARQAPAALCDTCLQAASSLVCPHSQPAVDCYTSSLSAL